MTQEFTLNRVAIGDCRVILPTLPAETFQCCVTSPPYWGLRDYGHEGQIGQEETPEAFVAALVDVFREVRRVLRDDGTLWLNIGDTYTANGLVGAPWRTALALQADGWFLRSDIVWAKPNPTPESVRNRPSKSHEYLFLLTKKRSGYYYDADSIREPHDSAYSRDVIRLAGGTVGGPRPRGNNFSKEARHNGDTTPRTRAERAALLNPLGRNARSVWEIPTKPYRGAHFAVFPNALAERCLRAGSAHGDAVIDPFMGSGTVGEVAGSLGRRWFGCELNPEYGKIVSERTAHAGLPFLGGASTERIE